MMNASMLTITTPSDREIAMTRVFAAPARLVYDAHTKPELLKRWLGVFGGWSLSTCALPPEYQVESTASQRRGLNV